MLEIKITIVAPDLAAAVNNLAAAIDCGKAKESAKGNTSPTPVSIPKPVTHGESVNYIMPEPTIPVTPIAPNAVATNTNPTGLVPGVPSNAAPVHSVVPVANPVVPVVNPAPVVPGPIPTSTPQYTLEMLAMAGSSLIDSGKLEQLVQLLGKFNVASLTDLAPESYGAVAAELRALGAAI